MNNEIIKTLEDELRNFKDEKGKNSYDVQDQETVKKAELAPEILANEEKGIFSKFQGKAKSIAKALILLTFLTFSPKPNISSYDKNIREGPRSTLLEKEKPIKSTLAQEEIAQLERKEKNIDQTKVENKEQYDQDYYNFKNLLNKDCFKAFNKIDKYLDSQWMPGLLMEWVNNKEQFGNAMVISCRAKIFYGKPWAKDLILDYYKKRHDYTGVVFNLPQFIKYDWAKDMVLEAIKKDPKCLDDSDVGVIESKFKNIHDPEIETLCKIMKSKYGTGDKDRAKIFFKEITNNKLGIDEVKSDEKLFRLLSSNQKIIDKDEIESADNLSRMRNLAEEICLKKLVKINNLHNFPDSIRFESVKNFSSNELYFLTVFGKNEAYTSTYNGLFNRLIIRTEKENISGYQLLQKMKFYNFRTFIGLASRYNRLNEFLIHMDKDNQEKLLYMFCSDINNEESPIREAYAIADVIGTADSKYIDIFTNAIHHEYDIFCEKKDEKNQILYGILGSLIQKRYKTNEQWLVEMDKKYRLPDIKEKIEANKLFDHNQTNIQQYYFYNDEDGGASYEDFLGMYQNQAKWVITDKGNFITIESRGFVNKMIIFANKPTKESGQDEIRKYMQNNKISPQVIVHRGHSYHTSRTIDKIPNSAQIVFLGSCGGYNDISNIFEKNNNAQIISTKGTGTGLVNDPLLKMLNEEILKGKNIYWNEFWKKAEKKLANQPDFRNYISPNKNQSALFLAAYNKYIKEK